MGGWVHAAHRRAVGADDLARSEALAALAVLTEREVAMFALALLLEVKTPALCGLMDFIAFNTREHGEKLREAATRNADYRIPTL